jgi:hypothetical protein
MPTDDAVTRLDACAIALPNESDAGSLLSRLKKVLMVTVRLLLM